MLKDELMTTKEMNRKTEDVLNKIWYSELKDCLFDYIKTYLPIDSEIIVPINTEEIMLNFIKDGNLFTVFSFIRSKLWNEGINLLISQDGDVWFVKVRDNEKYNDNYILNMSQEELAIKLTYAELNNDFSFVNDSLKIKTSNETANKKPEKKESKKSKKSKKVINADNVSDVVYPIMVDESQIIGMRSGDAFIENISNVENKKVFDYANSVSKSDYINSISESDFNNSITKTDPQIRTYSSKKVNYDNVMSYDEVE